MKESVKSYFEKKSINREIPIPLHFQLYQIIKEGIEADLLNPGDMLPTEEEFSRCFNISRTTIRQALTTLVSDRLLYRVSSKGTFVSHKKTNLHYISSIESFETQVSESGKTPSTSVLELKVVPSDKEIASLLQLSDTEQVIFLKRLRFINSKPTVVVESYLPHTMCSHILDFDLEKNSLLHLLSKRGESRVVRVQRTLEAIGASPSLAKLLQVEKGFPIQFFTNISYNKNGKIVEFCTSYYRGDKYSFSVELTAQP